MLDIKGRALRGNSPPCLNQLPDYMWLTGIWQGCVLGLHFGYTGVGRYSSDCKGKPSEGRWSENIHLQPLGQCQSLSWPSLLRRQPATCALEAHWFQLSGLPWNQRDSFCQCKPSRDATPQMWQTTQGCHWSLCPSSACSFPSHTSCPLLPVRVVLALLWGWFTLELQVCRLAMTWLLLERALPKFCSPWAGAHGSPTLGLHSLMSCLSPLSQFLSPPGKANFPSSSHFPTNLQTKPTPVPPNSPELTPTSPGTGRTPVADFAIRLGMLCSTLQAWQKRKCLNASVHWDWV